jgi:hypothetical protein
VELAGESGGNALSEEEAIPHVFSLSRNIGVFNLKNLLGVTESLNFKHAYDSVEGCSFGAVEI